MGEESVPRVRAREAMKTGRLPDHRPERVWGGLGSGKPCAVCGEAVDKDDVELELQFASDQVAAATSYHVHAKCFGAWETERRSRDLNGHSLPPADDGGIISGRERKRSTGDQGAEG
jgi:hypothetical protein